MATQSVIIDKGTSKQAVKLDPEQALPALR